MTIATSAGKSFTRWLTTPTVLAEWPIAPRWHLALKQVRMLLVLTAYSLAWFWFGSQAAPPSPGQAAFNPVTAAVAPEVASAPDDRAAPAAKPSAAAMESLAAEDAAGLRIEHFRIGAVYGYSNRLRYELSLSNKGRKLVGQLQFLVVGEQNGELSEMPLDQPAALAEAKPNVEVSRQLNTRGYLDLPEGYVVHKVVVQVVEGRSPRVAQMAPMWPT